MTTSPKRNRPNDSEPAATEVMSDRMLDAAGVESDSAVALPSVEALRFDDDSLLAIQSFDDAFALLADAETPVVDASQVIGNGFAILNDKSILQGVKMLLLGWRFNKGDKGVFCSAYVVAQMPGMNVPAKFVMNDGSTGICKQLIAYTQKTGRTGGLIVNNGLRRSDYEFTDSKGATSSATTFYLDTSA